MAYPYPRVQSQPRLGTYDGFGGGKSVGGSSNLPPLGQSKSKARLVAEAVIKKSPSELVLERREFGALHGRAGVHRPKIQEFMDLTSFSHQNSSVVPVDVPLFRVDPPMVTYSDFQGLQVYEASLTFRNQDTVARRVKVFPPDSPYFELMPKRSKGMSRGVSSGSGSGDKVAPGMEVCYIVRFKPDARIDYSYDLTVITEREKFTVPIRASGGSAILEFPDVIDFGPDCVVGHETDRTVLVQNIGDRGTKFMISSSPPFSCFPPSSRIQEGGSVQVAIRFRPERAEPYEGELILRYGELEAHVVLCGTAKNAEVALSHSHLVVDDTYVGLETQGVVTIRNDSDVPIDFSWRLFASAAEEQQYRLALHNQLKAEERDETLFLSQSPLSEDGSEEDSCSDDERLRARREAKVTNATGRKYGSIRKAIDEDPMLYHDPTFAIEPRSGRVWSHSQLTCAVCFRPKEADCYSGTAYLSCVGQEERAPLVMKGLGIGPKATFSYDELDVSNVFVESVHRYEVQLLNQGDVEVDFRILANDSKFSNMFKFTPDSGLIGVGGQCEITVDFNPTELGAFHVIFEWVLKGSATSVNLGFRGTVVQPTFEFDTDRINFGIVSYGFLNSRMLTLTNTAEVPMNYTLHVPGDEGTEFEIVPSKGMLLPGCTQRVQVDFVSMTEKKYDHKLAVDLEGIGKEIYSIPITAQCAVPTVTFEPHGTINYGDVFIRYPFHQSLYLHNTSNLPAKFEVLPPEDKSKADFEPDQWNGSMPPCASHVITFTLTTHSQGPVKLPVYVRILGRAVPFPLVLTANSVGPRVVVDPPMLEWGNVKCLEPSTRHVKITNQSCIDASVRAFMNDRKSLWTVHPKVIHLSPQETLQLALTLKIDETSSVQDVLNLVVNEGQDLSVQVKGKGIETPVICEQDLSSVDFGTLFTTHQEARDVVVKNYGRCARRITWMREKDPKENKRAAPPNGKDEKLPPPVIFRVEPESTIIEPKSAFRFTFVASSAQPGMFEDHIACIEKLEKGANAGKQIFKPQVKATFVAPQLMLSRSELAFNFRLEKDKPIDIMAETLTLENNGPLDVGFKAVVKYPFSVNIEEGSIPSKGKLELAVDFDPAYKIDRKCGTLREKLIVQYDDHPATNVVELVGNVMWPNLELDTNKLDFGTILNDTSKAMEVKLKNPTALVVSYRWCLAVRSIEAENQIAMATTQSSNRGSPALLTPQETKSSFKSTALGLGRATQWLANPHHAAEEGGSANGTEAVQEQVEVNQIFDLLPIFGTLQPGDTQTTTFTYTGLQDRAFKAYAVCIVEGGPEYEVMLRGAAAACKFHIDKQELDFGDIPFTEVGEAEVNLTNHGKMPLNFNFNLVQMSRPNVVEFIPASGVLEPEGKQKSTQKVIARFRAGIPADVAETVLVEVVHFEPVALKVVGRGTFPGVVIGLPRLDEAEHRVALAAARMRVHQKHAPTAALSTTSATSAGAAESAVPMDAASAAAEGSAELMSPEPLDLDLDGEARAADPEVPLEFEVDRHYLCEALLQNPERATQSTLRVQPTGRSNMGGKKKAEPPPVTAAQYRLDFGNIALGQSARRDVKIFNSGQEPVVLTIDKKLLKEHGFYPDPEAIPKLLPQQMVTISLTSTRAREAAEGLQELEWNLPVRGGPNYKIFISSNFVLPDLVLSSKSLDFGRVLLGRRKYMSLEMKNQKAVQVEWLVDEPRDRIGKIIPSHLRTFQISPTSGILKPDESLILTVSFTPHEAKNLIEALKMRLRDNPKPKNIQVLGRGEGLQLEVQPATAYDLGPVMPNQEAVCELILHNPADYPIEVYSMEFDQQYVDEEQLLLKYDGYVAGIAELPVRLPGENCWKQVARRVAEIRAEETGEPLPPEEEENAEEAVELTPEEGGEAAAPEEEGEAAEYVSEQPPAEEAEGPVEPAIPPPAEVQLVTLPQDHPKRAPPANFTILTPVLEPVRLESKESLHSEQPDRKESKKDKAAKEKAEKEKAEKEKAEKEKAEKEKKEKAEKAKAEGQTGQEGEAEEEVEEVEMVERLIEDKTRWILDKGQQQRLLVRFQSREVADHSSVLQFAVMDDVGPNPVTVSMRGIAALPGISTDPRTIFARRKKKRPEGGYGNKCFITSLGIYDFGPLLAGRDPETRRPAPQTPRIEPVADGANAGGESSGAESSGEEVAVELPEPQLPPVSSYVLRHLEVIHLTNDSLFPANVQLTLASKAKAQEEAAHEPPPAPAKKGKKHEEPPPPPPPPAVYIVEPETLQLAQGEAAEVRVWCFPPENGICEDTLLAQIEHNPEPVCFGLCALGTSPTITLDKEDVDFGRLLVNFLADPQKVRIKNQSALPTKFQLVCLESKVLDAEGKDLAALVEGQEGGPRMPEEFSMDPQDGTLAANEERDVRVGFRAVMPSKFAFTMGLQVKDLEGLRGWQDAGKLSIAAETFAVHVVVDPDPAEKMLDFGTVLVGASEQRTFEVVNMGKYAVRFQLGIRRSVSELLSIDTRSGELQPDGKAVITVTCNPKRVAEISGGDAIVLQILDSASGEAIDHKVPPIRVAVSAVYNAFQATPPRGLNFGPVENGDTQTRTFSVRNTGIFQFDWCLFNSADPPTFGDGGRPPPPPATVQVGPFSVTPTSGKLQPEDEVSVNVTFKAAGDQDDECKLSIWVDGLGADAAIAGATAMLSPTSPTRKGGGVDLAATMAVAGTSTYLLTGQSCVPGINTSDMQVIFEEQFYARTLEDAHLIAGRNDIRVFCEADKIFNFGPTLVYSPGGIAGQSRPADPVVEKLRLTNSKAVGCKVMLKVKSRDSDAQAGAGGKKGGKAPAENNLPFQVRPSELQLGPHDSQQIEVSFQPPHLANFAAVFEASVVSGSDPRSNFLRFDLRGEGTVPAAALEGTAQPRDDQGNVVKPATEEKVPEKVATPPAKEDEEPLEPPVPPVLTCDHESIPFAPTVMFAKKVFRFVVKNTSASAAPYAWRIDGPTASSFVIAPATGAIQPESEAEFEVRFAPTECEEFDCHLRCMWTVDREAEPLLTLPLTGSAIRPWCHIELEPSTYQSKRESDIPLDPKYSVVEIVSLGTKVKNTKRFYVYNPTAEAYDFLWMREMPAAGSGRPGSSDDDPFRCLTKRGTIQPSKKFEMIFEFCPMTQETRESFWTFVLVGPKVEQHFLIAGTVTEPRVGFDIPSLNFGERLLEGAATETVRLVNKERIPFSYAFDASSFQSGQGDLLALHVTPMTGVVSPGGVADIMITFKPLEERTFNYNVICNVKRKEDPVTLNIKGIGYKIHASLQVEEQTGHARRTLNAGVLENLDFGVLQVQEERTMTLFLKNASKRNFNFRALVQASAGRRAKPVEKDHLDDKPPFLRISPPDGVAVHHEETPIQITYVPRDVHRLDGAVLQIMIPSGPNEETFSMHLAGGAKRSRVELSFMSHDFGPCFIAGNGAGETMAGERLPLGEAARYERMELIATNRDDSDCMITTNFQRESWLDVQLEGAIIEANSSLRIPIIFTPREVIEYMQRVEFVINDYTRMNVDIRGRGSPLRLELADPQMQNVDFGVATGGQSLTRKVTLVNRSPRPVTFELGEEKAELMDRGITWSPSHTTTLRPRESLEVELYFKPLTRVAPFRAPLFAKCEHGVEVRLLQMAGTCHATEMRLSEHSLSFGDVVVGSQATRTVRLQNFGDLGSKFRFEVAPRYRSLFSISPSEGFVRPQEELSVVMSFHPDVQKIHEYSRNKDRANMTKRSKQAAPQAAPIDVRIAMKDLRCVLTDHPPLTLDVYGHAISEPGETKLLQFSTDVRKQEVQTFKVANPTQTDWKVRPQVSTSEPPGASYWSCPQEVVVPAGKDAAVEVTYMPLLMTDNGSMEATMGTTGGRTMRYEKHRGTIFIGAPNGSAVMYNLEGTARPPKVDRRIDVEVPCKKQHVQKVPIKNWLQDKQRFEVKVELVDPEPSSKAAMGINLHGVPTLDLPPALERDYKFNIYAYQEGSALVRVTFSSRESGEFVVIEVGLKFVAVESLGTIDLEAACRQLVRHRIVVANPLDRFARFTGSSTNPHLRFSPTTLEVPPKCERPLELLYRPLEEGEGEAVVTLQSTELGKYPYAFKWRATPPAMERTLVLKAPLGGAAVETFKFVNFARQQVVYEAKIEAAPSHRGPVGDFVVENSPIKTDASTGDDGTEVSLNVRFQPSSLGESRAMLVVKGANGGEYKAMVAGFAQPPQPQGPISILNGKQAPVEFRNPFSQATEFTFQLDNACFTIPMRQQRLDANKTITINVAFKATKAEGGRLMISCDKVSAPWVIFLKGEA